MQNIQQTINIRIIKKSYYKLNRIKKWYNTINNTNIKQKDLFEYIINDFIKNKELDYILQEHDEEDIRKEKFIMKKFRIDNNISPTAREYIQAIREYLKNDNIKNTDDIIIEMGKLYEKTYPEIKKILQNNEYIKRHILVEKADKEMTLEEKRQLWNAVK